jgi:ribosomal protein S18 acetylase RimI-like enzyme
MTHSNNTFIAEIFDPRFRSWNDVAETVIAIEREAFAEKAFSDEDLASDFQDTRNIVALLRSTDSDAIIGFSYAKPLDDERERTAFIWDTVIREEFRHKHLVGVLMQCLEAELKERGYEYLEREAAIANGYAENISKHYKGRIVEQGKPHDSIYGQQIFFRIRL